MPCDLFGKIFDEIGWQIMFSKLCFYFSLPIRKRAIAHAKPNTQNKPGSSCQYNENKMHLPSSFGYPAKEIEYNNGQMNKTEQYIKKHEHSIMECISTVTSISEFKSTYSNNSCNDFTLFFDLIFLQSRNLSITQKINYLLPAFANHGSLLHPLLV